MDSANGGRDGVRKGTRAGAVAWLLGVGVALVLWWLFASGGGGPVRFLASAIVFYYAFHLWPVIPVIAAGDAVLALFAPISMLLLCWAGFRTAVGAETSSGADGFRLGATVVTGYLPLSLLSLPAFALVVGTSPLADPLVTVAIVGITGVVFPVVFGGLGGWLAGR
ncbi:hypothetical protein [Halorhabdus amylolytica]|uniref:hypothetical protein n=1 Tax=Halorhabdus amylolytica TaxID=2559573 RepID=UPI0010AB3B23|nr:hypothetical protein [Halorhabdus amylolytica]